ncbi:MAG: DNA methylase, partial [Acaryochloridaceae cyanobacterium RL_2_7]|nr:DNA methylase [Acaryochloridaceae cyanobacterium RL_2_7]
MRSRTIKDKAETPQESLLASLNEYGDVVPGYMAQLLGVEESQVLSELQAQNLIFQDPVSQRWLTEDEYLSGDVRRKLAIAQNMVQDNPQFQGNVVALESVQPQDLEPGEIDVRLGAPWLPTEVIQDFAYELLEVSPDEHDIKIAHSSDYAVWSVEFSPELRDNERNLSVYGTDDWLALKLLEQSLNLKDATV